MPQREPPQLLAWIDLETTGGDEHKDSILEFAMVLTKPDLEEVGHLEALIAPDPAALEAAKAHPEIGPMHTDNGLFQELEEQGGMEAGEVAAMAVDILKDRGAETHKVWLCGSGVLHFDRRFLKAQMPRLERWFPYYGGVDIGQLRRACSLWAPALIPTVSDDQLVDDLKPHRAMADVRVHLQEASAYKQLLEHFAIYERLDDAEEATTG